MPQDNAPDPSRTPLAEWIVAGLGLLIVAGAILLMLQEAVSGDRSPPDVKLEVDAISTIRNGYLVQFRATNEGGKTAADVAIEGTHTAGDEEEKSEATLDFLPPHSTRRGGLFFRRNPEGAGLELRAGGYREP